MAQLFYFWKTVTTNTAQISFGLLGGLCCLLPLILGLKSELEDSPLRNAMESRSNRDAAVASLSISLPILMDIATEIILSITSSHKLQNVRLSGSSSLMNPLERMTFVVGTLLIPITAFLTPETTNAAYIYVCFTKCQLTIVGAAVLASLCRYNEKFFSVRSTYCVLILEIISTVSGTFGSNRGINSSPSLIFDSLSSISNVVALAGAVLLFYLSSKWLLFALPKLCKGPLLQPRGQHNETLANSSRRYDGENLLFPVMYVFSIVVSLSLLIALGVAYSDFGHYNQTALFNHNLAFIIYLLLIVYISTRMMKNDIVHCLVS